MIAFLYINPQTGRLVKASVEPFGIPHAVVPEDADINRLALVNGRAVEVPPRPSPWAVLDGASWVDPRPAAEIAADVARRVRAKRDRLLADSDFSQLPDADLTEEERAAWTIYRQQLRDVPETVEGLDTADWPQPPNIKD